MTIEGVNDSQMESDAPNHDEDTDLLDPDAVESYIQVTKPLFCKRALSPVMNLQLILELCLLCPTR